MRERYEKGEIKDGDAEGKDSLAQMLLEMDSGDAPDPDKLKEILEKKSQVLDDY